jgi:biopolymer transport protein ExbD
MVGTDAEQVGEGRLDLVPMIDCIMLLLLFFMMTTKFMPEEQVLAQILPTDQGSLATGNPTPPPPAVVVRITPAGLERGGQPSDYQRQLAALTARDGEVIQRAVIRVGNRPETVELDVQELVQKPGRPLTAAVERVHALVGAALADYERTVAGRTDQDPVSIQCYSGLSWQFAAVAYDAVRAYEADRPGAAQRTRADLTAARTVAWAPPRVRNYTTNDLGNEVFEILHAR